MDVIVDGRRYRAIPDRLGPWVEAYARARGRDAAWAAPDTLEVHGPLHGRRFALDVAAAGDGVQVVAVQSAILLERLGATVLVTGGDREDAAGRAERLREFGPEALVCLRPGRYPSPDVAGLRAQPLARFRRTDLHLARALLERMALHTGLSSRGVPLWPWSAPDLAPLAGAGAMAAVVVECGCSASREDAEVLGRPWFAACCACGLAEGLMRFCGLSPHQVAAYRLADTGVQAGAGRRHGQEPRAVPTRAAESAVPAEPAVVRRGRASHSQEPEPMVLTGKGDWISPRAQTLLERRNNAGTHSVDYMRNPHAPDAEE